MKSREILYYTDNTITDPILSASKISILQAGLPITSVSLKPIEFGKNIQVEGERGYKTYIKQIITGLESMTSDYVFFCEHDVLYPSDHFDFVPQRDDIFYYNENVFRWMYGTDTAITYERLVCLSGLCVNRNLALSHYRLIQKKIDDNPDSFDTREPELARKWGYEPGTKKKKRGGLTDEDFETFRSKYPIIDIRHSGTFSPPKVTLESFKHPPKSWEEVKIEEIPGWDLRGLFNL